MNFFFKSCTQRKAKSKMPVPSPHNGQVLHNSVDPWGGESPKAALPKGENEAPRVLKQQSI